MDATIAELCGCLRKKKNTWLIFFFYTFNNGGMTWSEWSDTEDVMETQSRRTKSLQEEKYCCCSAHETLMSHSHKKALVCRPPPPSAALPTLHPRPSLRNIWSAVRLCAHNTDSVSFARWLHGSLQHSPTPFSMLRRESCEFSQIGTEGRRLTDDWLGKLNAVGLNNPGCSPWWPISACQSINWHRKRFNSRTRVRSALF